MKASCTCRHLSQWAQDPDIPITERGSEYYLGDGSVDDARLAIHFCPFCGEHGWPDRGDRLCECGVMEQIVRQFPDYMEFDSKMNEFHILQQPGQGKLQVYYCTACGGNPPVSLRHTFFEEPTTSDYAAAWSRIENLKNEKDFIEVFGAPAYVFDLPPLPAKDVEIYGMKQMKKQWTFEPPDSPISYCLQLMADDTYHKSLGPKHKKTNGA